MTSQLRVFIHSILLILTTCALPATAQVTFSAPFTYASGGQGTSNVIARDLTGDGKPDLVVVNPTTNNLGVLLNSGTGAFPATATTYGSGARVGGTAGLAVGDVDNDGWPDLVTANGYDNTVGVLLNSGSGTFAATATTYSAGASSRPVNVALGDVNGDGRLDIVTANLFNYTVGVLLGRSTGGFAAPVTYSTLGYESGSVTVGDVNRDGKPDILMGCLVADVILGYLNDGRGGFAAAPVFYLRGPSGIINDMDLIDMNNDGFSDLVGAFSGLIDVVQGTSSGFGLGFSYDPGRNIIAKAAAEGDLNMDGRPDVVSANASTNTVGVFLNTGTADILPALATLFATSADSGPTDVAIADINGDTKPDIITANATSGTVGILLNTSTITTTTPAGISFTPSSGAPGTAVTVTGTNLTGITGLAFNGVPATGITVNSSTSVTTYVPVNATSGPLKLTWPTSSSTSAASFTVVPTKADVTVAVAPAGPLSACGGPTLTAVASTKPFALAGTGVGGYPHVTALQPDGKILVGGYFDSFNGAIRGGVLRLNADGSLDPTFAPTGSGINYDVDAMVLQPDGKVLVGGRFTTYNGANCRYLTRLNADGTRDVSFNLSGTGLNSFVQALALQPDGKILVGGTFSNYNSTIRNAVLRLNADGSLDTSFAIAGTGIVGTINTIAVQPDGRLLVGGYIERFNGSTPGSLVRLTANGALDNTFRVAPLSGSTVLTQTLQADGKIYISGAVIGPNGRQQSIVRLLPSGSLDYSFSPVGSGLNSAVNAIAIQPNGKVVVAGIFNEYNGVVNNRVVRLNADGTLDTSFSTSTGPSYGPDDMVLQPNGKIIIVGTFSTYNGTGPGKIARLNANGTPDVTATPLADATYAWSPSGTTGATVVPNLAGGNYQAVATVNGSLYLSNSVTVTSCLNAPAITSFTPTSGPIGTVLTVNGTNLAGTSSVTFSGSTGNVVSSGFVVNAMGTQLTGLIVPVGAQTGPFSINNSGGVGSSPGSFTVTAPVISSLSPASVVAGSNAFTLTVNGSNFVRGAVVNLNGVNLTTTYLSDTQLTASVLKASTATAGSYPVRVANSAVSGNSTSAQATFTVTVPVPTISSFTPASGLAGTAVTVTGTNLIGATTLTLNGVAVPSFVVSNATTLIFTVPAGATSGLITVTTAGGMATSASPLAVSTPNLVPIIASISPSSVLVNSGALQLAVNGGNFVRSSVVNFPLGTVATIYVSSSQLLATVPAAYLTGLGSGYVTVTSPAPGGGTSNGVLFSVVLPAPTITSFTPASGPVGTTVTVKGTNFQLVTDVGLAAAGNTNAPFTVLDANTLTFVVPAGAASGPVGISTSGGTGYSAAPFTVTATPNPVPAVTSLAPTAVVAGSGAFTLTVEGTSFVASSAVSFNGAPLPTTYVSATQVLAQVPASALATPGAASVSVTNPAPGGGASASATFTITAPAPTLASLTPASGLVGTTVTVAGTNLTGATNVLLNGTSVTSFTVVDATTLTFVVPTGGASGLVTVITPGGTATSPNTFIVVLPTPTIANLTPNSIVAGSSDFSLVVNGTGFLPNSVVSFNAMALATIYSSATQLTAQVPAAMVSTVGTYGITVTNPSAAQGGSSTSVPFEVLTPAPALVSFLPASGPVGTSVTVKGANLLSATAIQLNGASVGSFAVADATTLTFVVPVGATSGLVTVTTLGGTVTSSTAFTVTVPNPMPTITSLTPASAVAGSGAITVTVSGSDFIAGSEVSFAGTALATTYVSATQLTATLPASALGTAGSYDVFVTNPLPGGGTSAPVPFTITTPTPTLMSFSPASGLVGTTVTVVGTDLTNTTSVTLNGEPVSFTVVNATTLTFVVPTSVTSGLLSVTTPGGTATSTTPFTVLLPNLLPTLATISPNAVVAGSPAFALTVTGTNFSRSSVVQLAGTSLATTYQSATQLIAEVPASAVAIAGSYGITVTNPSPGGGTTAELALTVTVPAPVITSFTPASGMVGTTVTVVGTYLNGVTALTLNGLVVSDVTLASPTLLSFVVPAGASSGLLSVTTLGGTTTSNTVFTVIAANPLPAITSLTPATVVAGSGAITLTITGNGFLAGSVVSFAGTALATTHVSTTQLTATLPASALGTAGNYEILVTNPAPGGEISAPATFTVTPPAPTLLSFAPSSGSVGTLVTITGTNLLSTKAVVLNNASVGSFTVVDATTLTFVVPAGATSGLVALTTPSGTASSTAAFTVLLPTPTIASLSPAEVVVGSGSFSLVVKGTGFVNGSVINFGNTALSTTYDASTQLTAQVPASLVATAGLVNVVVVNPSPEQGGSSTAATFTITEPTIPTPTLVSFTPGSGPSGTLVTVTGTNLAGTSTVLLNGTSVGSFTIVDAATLTFVLPVGATSGLLTVVTPGGTATSTSSFTVLLPNPTPVISSLSPNSVVAGSGALVLTVTGTGYVSNSVVLFNGTPLLTTFQSATQLTATISATALTTAGTAAVTVENPAPGGGRSASVDFTVLTPAPTLVSFTPASGLVGTLITVTGTNLLGATTVSLNGAPIATYTVASATTLTFTVPMGGTSGPIAVTTPGGTATSVAAFTVIEPNPVPTLLSLSPGTLAAGSSDFTLTLTGTDFSSGSEVVFNGTMLATTYVSATQLTAQVPAGAVAVAGSYDVAVRNPAPGGGSSAVLPFVVTVPVPTISSFTPTSGGANTLVTITGTNLTGATQVRIGSVLIPTFTVVSATSLTLVVPSANGTVSGFIAITTPSGTATSTTAFSVVLASSSSQAQLQLAVYPNPFHSSLTVLVPGARPVQVLLREVTGRVVLPLTTLPANKELDLPHDLAMGVYLLEVHQGDTTTTRRIVKQ